MRSKKARNRVKNKHQMQINEAWMDFQHTRWEILPGFIDEFDIQTFTPGHFSFSGELLHRRVVRLTHDGTLSDPKHLLWHTRFPGGGGYRWFRVRNGKLTARVGCDMSWMNQMATSMMLEADKYDLFPARTQRPGNPGGGGQMTPTKFKRIDSYLYTLDRV
ncbi:hypothetical protein E3N88_00430 [Mikania micrantha]|uniref:Uncharacterized protein n=1 Tax=Mikania micrantha TaxID=192012 RepID=A0A5N6PY38_9ASTR|nr:hypothetical protein E3N88_00430 [Mikania micrantha]